MKNFSEHNNFLAVGVLTVLLLFSQFFYEILNIDNISFYGLTIMLGFYFFIGYFFNYILLFLIDKLKYISKRLSVIVLKFIFSLAVVLFAIDAFLLYKFNGILDQTKLSVVFSADPYTVKEFLLNYIISDDFIIMIILLAFVFFLNLKLKKKSFFEFPQIKILNKWSKPCFVGSIIILLLIVK